MPRKRRYRHEGGINEVDEKMRRFYERTYPMDYDALEDEPAAPASESTVPPVPGPGR